MKEKKLWLCAIILIALGYYGTIATHIVQETRYSEEIPGTKERNALIGGGTGFLAGGATGASIGGVGVVACGTGVGIPAGLVLLGLAGMGGGLGAGVGWLTGEPTQTPIPYTVNVLEKTYPEWLGLGLMALGVLMMVWLIVSHMVGQMPRPQKDREATDSKQDG